MDFVTEQLTTIGKSIEHTISNNIYEREREIILLSKRRIFSNAPLDYSGARNTLDTVQNSYQYYSWIGFANASGKVEAAASGLLEGDDVSARPWFVSGQTGPFIGDVHEAVLLSNVLNTDKNNPLRLIDFAAPVYDMKQHVVGVVAAHANWEWVNEVIESVLPTDARDKHIEVRILDNDGKVLYPFNLTAIAIPRDALRSGNSGVMKWGDGKYLTSVTSLHTKNANNLGWTIIVRIPEDIALKKIAYLHEQLSQIRKTSAEAVRKGLILLNMTLDHASLQGYIEINPARLLKPAMFGASMGKPRERWLPKDELQLFWQALEQAISGGGSLAAGGNGIASSAVLSSTIANVLRLIILTGVRRSEAA